MAIFGPSVTEITSGALTASFMLPTSAGSQNEISAQNLALGTVSITSNVTPVTADRLVYEDISGGVLGRTTMGGAVVGGCADAVASPFAASSVAAGDVFLFADVSNSNATASVTASNLVRAATLLTSTVTPDKADTIQFNDVSGSVPGVATLAAVVAAGLQQPAAASGAGANLPIRAENATGGNTNGGNVVLVPGDNAGSGVDGRISIAQPGSESNVGQLYQTASGTVFNVNGKQLVITDTNGLAMITFLEARTINVASGATILTNGDTDNPSLNSLRVGISNTAALSKNGASYIQVTSPNAGIAPRCTFQFPPLTPSQITGDQNNYAPGVARYYRLSSDAARTITGMSLSQVDGATYEIWNVGSFAITLANQSGSSTAANRFLTNTNADIVIGADGIAIVRYDATTQRFRAALLYTGVI